MSKKPTELKKNFYVFSFTILGLLMATVVYGLGSIILITKNYQVNLNIYLFILLVGGGVAGYMEGNRWWEIIYVRKAYLKWPKHRLEAKFLGLFILVILAVAIIFLTGKYL